MPTKANRSDLDNFFDYDLHLSRRLVYMGSVSDYEESGVDHKSAERLIKALHIIDLSEGPITIISNCVGGDEYHGFAIYDAIRMCKNHVEMRVFGHCMSMGLFILQAADKRIVSPNSRIMMHYGTWAFEGHSKDAERWGKECTYLNKRMEDVLFHSITQKKKQFKIKELRAMLNFDTFLSAQEAVEYGLADEILSGE